jgi:hypothetical protein
VRRRVLLCRPRAEGVFSVGDDGRTEITPTLAAATAIKDASKATTRKFMERKLFGLGFGVRQPLLKYPRGVPEIGQ